MQSKLQRWGNSLAVRIPAAMVQAMQVREGDALELRVKGENLTIRPARPKFKLEELVAGITPANRHSEVEWGPSVGAEFQ